MAKYSTFKYGTGVKYGGSLGSSNLFKLNLADPSYAMRPRHIKVIVKHSTGAKWGIDNIRLTYARREHVIPTWIAPVMRDLKRTKVTIKYSTSEFWYIDSLRLKQRIKHKGPTV